MTPPKRACTSPVLRPYLCGARTMDTFMAKAQVQPVEASGIRIRPPAGMSFSQHEGRLIDEVQNVCLLTVS